MKAVSQDSFTPVLDRDHTVFVHTSKAKPQTGNLILFIHGWSGSGYGTWEAVLERMFEDEVIQADVGTINFVSGWRRLLNRTAPTPGEIADAVAQELRTVPHKRVVLIGHSMGGLLCREMLRRLFGAENPPHIGANKVAGIVTLATPNAGVGAADFAPLGAADQNVLRRHAPFQREIDRFFATHVEINNDAVPVKELHVPVYAAAASEDAAVSSFSALLGTPDSQVRTLRGTHSGILGTNDTYAWLTEVSNGLLTATRATHFAQTPAMITHYRGKPLEPDWYRVFQVSCEDFESREGIPVIEAPFPSSGQTPHLVMRVIHSQEGADETVRDVIRQDLTDRLGAVPLPAVGITPYGDTENGGVLALAGVVGSEQACWVKGASTLNELAEVMQLFLQLSKPRPRFGLGNGRLPAPIGQDAGILS